MRQYNPRTETAMQLVASEQDRSERVEMRDVTIRTHRGKTVEHVTSEVQSCLSYDMVMMSAACLLFNHGLSILLVVV